MIENCKCLERIPLGFEEENNPLLKRVQEKYPLLKNPPLLKKYPFIVQVTEVLEDTLEIHKRRTGEFKLFDRLEFKNIQIYLTSLSRNKKEAIRIYKEIIHAYGFEKSNIEKL